MRTIREYRPEDQARVLEICIAAFTPIHQGFAVALGPDVFARTYPDWRGDYARTIAAIGENPAERVYVIEADGEVAGFAFSSVDAKARTGELGLNAVDPAHQGKGLGGELYAFVLADLKARGAETAYVGTGADAAHAPARAAYERAGFNAYIPTRHYFRML
jgi:ribosomal protein S18 acetylase RimI-like enzyme